MTPGSLARAVAPLVLASPLAAQSFQFANGQIPSGGPFNNSASENVDFGDVDLDGDLDAVFADGGDSGNDQNRIWINQGGLQGGAPGFFADETAARCPAVADDSRDIELADLDGDGDLDALVSNTVQISNQPNRWWINQGGLQGGTAGFFVDETASRWLGIGGAGSSVDPALALPGGGFLDWSCDSDFGDLDSDGDPDLVHSSYGPSFTGRVPTRIFLNDGAGRFEEFNPSGFQLQGVYILDGQPGLWCEGVQQHDTTDASGAFCDIATTALDVDLGDVDADLDLDLVHGARSELPRLFANRLEENGGALGFRDVTGVAFPPGYANGIGHYEQELGDLDGDGDLDLYGVNWLEIAFQFQDATLEGVGDGTFTDVSPVPGSASDENEADFLDYDGDGDLDVMVANFSGQERLKRNDTLGAGIALVDVTAAQLPMDSSMSLDVDSGDLDGDGDPDAMVANDSHQPNTLLLNVTQVADAHAPRVEHLEQAPDRSPSPVPTVVRTHVYDNAPDYAVRAYDVRLEVSVNGGPFAGAPMAASFGQVFRGAIDGTLVGAIAYRVRAVDGAGNVGVSATLDYLSGPCAPPATYCTAKTSSSGCVPAIGWTGLPIPGFGLTATGSAIEPGQLGVLVVGQSGPLAQPFQGGLLCVHPPLARLPPQGSGGAAPCGGSYAFDLDPLVASLPPGTQAWAQLWFRDPGAASGSGLSDALVFTTCP